MLRMESGTLLVFAEGRKLSESDHGWNDVVLKRSTDNGAVLEVRHEFPFEDAVIM
jgi:hypothetical protein